MKIICVSQSFYNGSVVCVGDVLELSESDAIGALSSYRFAIVAEPAESAAPIATENKESEQPARRRR